MKVIELTTPSLGARLAPAGGGVRLQVGNEGGRGVPSHLLLLPLQSDDLQNLAFTLSCEEMRLGNGATGGAWNVYCNSLKDQSRPGPFFEEISPAEWEQANSFGGPLLVVLSFGDPRGETDTTDRLAPQACMALPKILVDPDKAAWRRRGLLVSGARRVPDPFARRDKPDQSSVRSAPPPSLVFVLASCQYPAGIVDGTPQDFEALGSEAEMPRGPADASLLRLHDRLVASEPAERPSLLLLAGDQIYVDATAGLFDARAVARPGARHLSGLEEEGLRVPYQNWLGSVGTQSVFGRLTTRMMLDDHEFQDNWEPVGDGPSSNANEALNSLKALGKAAYLRYQSASGASASKLWDEQFEHDGLRFFIADTRTERQARKAGLAPEGPRIMSERQDEALREWMAKDADRPAFVLSPSILLPRRRSSQRSRVGALRSDAWDGYPGSLERLLAHIGRTQRKGLVFLSGDEHLSCVVRATVTLRDWDGRMCDAVRLHSIHSSALYAPYPFANAQPEEFAASECWRFHDPDEPLVMCCCEVEVLRWAPGDGFACMQLLQQEGGWSLDVSFDRESREPQTVTLKL
jgi:hypothetical protein